MSGCGNIYLVRHGTFSNCGRNLHAGLDPLEMDTLHDALEELLKTVCHVSDTVIIGRGDEGYSFIAHAHDFGTLMLETLNKRRTVQVAVMPHGNAIPALSLLEDIGEELKAFFEGNWALGGVTILPLGAALDPEKSVAAE
jgi:hypothetical protein